MSPSSRQQPTGWQQVVVMEFGKRHDTTDTTDICPRQLVIDCTCCGETGVMDFGLYYAVARFMHNKCISTTTTTAKSPREFKPASNILDLSHYVNECNFVTRRPRRCYFVVAIKQ